MTEPITHDTMPDDITTEERTESVRTMVKTFAWLIQLRTAYIKHRDAIARGENVELPMPDDVGPVNGALAAASTILDSMPDEDMALVLGDDVGEMREMLAMMSGNRHSIT